MSNFKVGDRVVLADSSTDPDFWPDVDTPHRILTRILGNGAYALDVKVMDKTGRERWLTAYADELMHWEEYIATKTLMQDKDNALPDSVVESLATAMANSKANIIAKLLKERK